MIEQLKERKVKLESQIQELQFTIIDINNLIKEECQKLPFVEGLAEYIKIQEYPTELYDCFGMDSGEYDSFGKARLKIVYNWDYTDVIGLTKEEFEQLENLLEE